MGTKFVDSPEAASDVESGFGKGVDGFFAGVTLSLKVDIEDDNSFGNDSALLPATG